jgi:hypothetical protein
MKKIILLVLALISVSNVYSQASWHGRIYFNLADTAGRVITLDDVRKQNVRFYSHGGEWDYFFYDSDTECFVYDSHFITAGRFFFAVSGNRMLRVDFPALADISLFITTPIVIDNLTYDFYNSIDRMIDERRNKEVKMTGNYPVKCLPADSTENKGSLIQEWKNEEKEIN